MTCSTYVVAAGSNRPGRHGAPDREITAALSALPGGVTAAPIIASAPLGPSIRRFANTAVVVKTSLTPPELLQILKAIERRWGRRTGRRWGARVLDLDIILWSGGVYDTPDLTIPHSAFRQRAFVLSPIVKLTPDWRDPRSGLTMRQLHARLTRRRALPRRSGAGAGP